MKKAIQTSESLGLGIILAFSGGLMDAYSYLFRGQVFANAQTGNMLLFGVCLSRGQWAEALSYFLPIIFFAAGMVISIMVRRDSSREKLLHWRQTAVLLEALVLAAVCFMPQSANLPANSLISLACGIQLESFAKIRGSAVATTMCIGNLRVATESFSAWLYTKESRHLRKALLYSGVIVCFVLGAVAGAFAIELIGTYSLFICSALLLTVFALMFKERQDT